MYIQDRRSSGTAKARTPRGAAAPRDTDVRGPEDSERVVDGGVKHVGGSEQFSRNTTTAILMSEPHPPRCCGAQGYGGTP